MPDVWRAGRLGQMPRILLTVVALFGALAASAGELRPTWTRAAPAGVEWIAPGGGSPATLDRSLLLCGKDGSVEIFDPATGRSVMPAPHRFRGAAGVAGAPSIRRSLTPLTSRWKDDARRPLAYCFDRFTAAAFRIDDRALAWSGGAWPEEPGALAGDPEFLRRIVAARDVWWGVFMMRDDGRGVCLSRMDGAALWQVSLPSATSYDIDAIDTRAAVVWTEGDATRYAWLDIDAEAPTPRLGRTDQLCAFWSAACSSGLVLASAERMVLMRDGAPRTIYDGRHGAVYRATLGVLKSLAPESERVGFVTQDGLVCSASLASVDAWRRKLPGAEMGRIAPVMLQFDEACVLVGYGKQLALYTAEGEPGAVVDDWCGLAGSAGVRQGVLEYVARGADGSLSLVVEPGGNRGLRTRRALSGLMAPARSALLGQAQLVVAEEGRVLGFSIR